MNTEEDWERYKADYERRVAGALAKMSDDERANVSPISLTPEYWNVVGPWWELVMQLGGDASPAFRWAAGIAQGTLETFNALPLGDRVMWVELGHMTTDWVDRVLASSRGEDGVLYEEVARIYFGFLEKHGDLLARWRAGDEEIERGRRT